MTFQHLSKTRLHAVLQKIKWEDQYHFHTSQLNMKLQPRDGLNVYAYLN